MSRKDQPVHSETRHPYGGDERVDSHPAFGVAVVTRGTGHGRSLFQSDLLHRETITLSIHTAERSRSLHRDWVHPRKELIEVEMSLAQWGALIAAQGQGSGVPLTIRRTESVHDVPGIPHEPRTSESVDEARRQVQEMLRDALKTLGDLELVIEEKKGIRVVREALGKHARALQGAANNSAFAVRSVQEAVEDVVHTARSDIEAFLMDAERRTGLTASVEAPALEDIHRPNSD